MSTQNADTGSFTGLDLTKYSHAVLLVGEAMYDLLMEDENKLHNTVSATFEELDRCGKTILVSNTFRNKDDRFEDLYRRIPKRARKMFEEITSKQDAGVPDTPKGGKVFSITGVSGGKATVSNVIGSLKGDFKQNKNVLNIYFGDGTRKEGQQVSSRENKSTCDYEKENMPSAHSLPHDSATSYRDQMFLHEACRGGQLEAVVSLVSTSRVDINSKGEEGVTPVMIAAGNGYKQLFDWLVKKGCDLSVEDDAGNNILHAACYSDNVEIVEYLIRHKVANIEGRGPHGRTAVMIAAGRGNKKVFDLLVNERSDLSVVDDFSNTILHVACFRDSVEIVDYLIRHKVEIIESKGQYGRTAVMIAAEEGNEKVFDLLASKGSDLSVVDSNGNNILHVACFSDNVEIVDYLIRHKVADIESKGQYGRTAIMMAAGKGNKKVFDLLVSKGSDLSVVDDDRYNILHVACLSDSVEIVEYIISLRLVDIESRGPYGRTAIMAAAGRGNKNVFDLLIEKGSDLSVVDDDGNNILHIACFSDNVEIVEYLIRHKVADIESKDQYGNTAIMVAARKGNKKVFDLLMSLKK